MTLDARIWSLTLACLAFSLLAGPPLYASTWSDVAALQAALKAINTDLKESNDCEKGLLGAYQYEKGKYDEVVICINNIDKDDPEQYWEVLSHETTHAMQACTGGYALNDGFINSAYRELKVMNPTATEEMAEYGSWDKRQEVEARWMQMQTPQDVIALLEANCKGQ